MGLWWDLIELIYLKYLQQCHTHSKHWYKGCHYWIFTHNHSINTYCMLIFQVIVRGWLSPCWDSSPTSAERGFLTERRKEYKHKPALETRGQFVREEIMLPRQSRGPLSKPVSETPSAWGIRCIRLPFRVCIGSVKGMGKQLLVFSPGIFLCVPLVWSCADQTGSRVQQHVVGSEYNLV